MQRDTWPPKDSTGRSGTTRWRKARSSHLVLRRNGEKQKVHRIVGGTYLRIGYADYNEPSRKGIGASSWQNFHINTISCCKSWCLQSSFGLSLKVDLTFSVLRSIRVYVASLTRNYCLSSSPLSNTCRSRSRMLYTKKCLSRSFLRDSCRRVTKTCCSRSVRKDVMIEQSSQANASDAVMMSMTKSLAALSEQVQSLSHEIQSLRAAVQVAPPVSGGPIPSGQGPTGSMPRMMMPSSEGNSDLPPAFIGLPNNMPPPPMGVQSAHTPQLQQQIISPQPVLAPNVGALQQLISPPEDAEDVFLKAFSSLSEAELIQFVMSRMPRMAEYLPDPRERPSPLSQAVLLTMVHRVSNAVQIIEE
jgi:hypothetical protein